MGWMVLHAQYYKIGTQIVPYTEGSLAYTNVKKDLSGDTMLSNIYAIEGGSGWQKYNSPDNPTTSWIRAQELLSECKETLGFNSANVMLVQITNIK